MLPSRPNIGRELLDVPMGEMIREMAFSIADAQTKLDSNSIEVAQMMGGLKTITIDDPITGKEKITFEDSRVFFGTEKMTIGEAHILHNSLNDGSYKSEINKAISKTVEGYNGNTTPNATQSKTVIEIPARLSMLELGFSPTFYQFVDTIIEVRIAIKYTEEGSSTTNTTTNSKQSSGNVGFRLFRGFRADRNVTTTQVNASYTQKYGYSAEGSSLLRTKLVPIPPPAVLEERIRIELDKLKEKEKKA
jgi:hypothetical protein